MKTRADSPAAVQPSKGSSTSSAVESKPSPRTRAYKWVHKWVCFFSNKPDFFQDLATLGAVIVSTVLLYGKGPTLVSMATRCWNEEGAVIFCAKFVACILPFVSLFSAVIYLWLGAASKSLWPLNLKKAALNIGLSIWIICFGYAVFNYIQPELKMTAKDLYMMWFGSTALLVAVLSSSLGSVLLGKVAYECFWWLQVGRIPMIRKTSVAAGAVSVGLACTALTLIYCGFVLQSFRDVQLVALKFLKVAITLPVGLFSIAMVPTAGKVFATSQYIKAMCLLASSTLLLIFECLAIYSIWTDDSFTKTVFLRYLAKVAAFIVVCAGCGSGGIFLWRKFKSKAD